MRSCTVSKRLATGQSLLESGQSLSESNQSENLCTLDISTKARPTSLTVPSQSAVQDNQLDIKIKNIVLNENILNQTEIINTVDNSNSTLNSLTSGRDKSSDRINIPHDINVTKVVNIHKCPSHFVTDQIQTEGIKLDPLRPLLGVPLPKTDAAWGEMNLHLHASPLFRFAVGKIGDLDLAAEEFNQSIYNYLKGKYGTLKGTETVTKRGDPAFEIKYQNWSRSRIRRGLSKLKSRGPVIEGSSLCDEIQYLLHRLRLEMASRPQAARPVTDKDFQIGFWPTCQKIFLDVAGALPTFNIHECGAYFLKVLSIPDSLRACIFQIPQWFVALPPPAIPFDLSAPSYAEIASIIKKARTGSSACPLDQISVISLKRCPILRTILHNIIANCWQSQYTPKAWRVGVTILIYKKGDPSKVDNFRPITLQSVPYKIFSSFIRNRLQAYLDKNSYHNNNIQKGFAHGQDGVLEHTELLDFMMSDAKKSHRGYFVVLLDLRNAFSEVHHNLIRSSLRYHHVPEAFIQVFNSIYSGFSVSVSSKGELTEMITVRRGVLQGDPCSPLLFNICFNSLMRLLEAPGYRHMGYMWGKRQHQPISGSRPCETF